MVKTKQALGPEVIFDGSGNGFRLSRRELAWLLGGKAAGYDPVDYVVRTLGFICVRPMRAALVVEFEPATACPLAVTAAFYEIADCAPERIALVCRGEPDRIEIFCNAGHACQRIETLIKHNP